jgi:hypothetical protein
VGPPQHRVAGPSRNVTSPEGVIITTTIIIIIIILVVTTGRA